MTLPELLETRGIDRALIIDDGYDTVPTAADLGEAGVWENFISDLSLHEEVVVDAFPTYKDMNTDQLVQSDNFVAALWRVKGRLPDSVWDDLFGNYERGQESDVAFLATLEEQLRALGIEPTQVGRATAIADPTVPLVFVDLFLGGAQNHEAIQHSIERVREIVEGRQASPPLVVLMSRSDRLDMNKDRFRSETKLLGAMFRVSPKKALVEDDMLVRLLTRLVQHRDDGHRVAALLKAWEDGLDKATQSFMDKVRKLDLPDYAQVKDLLLAFEGQPLGSYLIDVFDRALQFEIEGHVPTIDAAREVNKVDLSRYLARNIAGTPDLQELVHQTIYHHPERLVLPATESGVPLSFGDVIGEYAAIEGGGDLSDAKVYSVMTPACDLARSGADNVLLIGGELKRLTWSEWRYAGGPGRTPIAILPNDRRYWIAWNLKDLQTWSSTDTKAKLGPDGDWRPFLRLRDEVALKLQQRMLADLGRVGQIAHMPAAFPIAVELHCVTSVGTW